MQNESGTHGVEICGRPGTFIYAARGSCNVTPLFASSVANMQWDLYGSTATPRLLVTLQRGGDRSEPPEGTCGKAALLLHAVEHSTIVRLAGSRLEPKWLEPERLLTLACLLACSRSRAGKTPAPPPSDLSVQRLARWWRET